MHIVHMCTCVCVCGCVCLCVCERERKKDRERKRERKHIPAMSGMQSGGWVVGGCVRECAGGGASASASALFDALSLSRYIFNLCVCLRTFQS